MVQWQGLSCLQNVTAHTTEKINYTLQAPWVVLRPAGIRIHSRNQHLDTVDAETFHLLLFCLPPHLQWVHSNPFHRLPFGSCEPCKPNLQFFFWNNNLHFTFYCYKPLCRQYQFFFFFCQRLCRYTDQYYTCAWITIRAEPGQFHDLSAPGS